MLGSKTVKAVFSVVEEGSTILANELKAIRATQEQTLGMEIALNIQIKASELAKEYAKASEGVDQAALDAIKKAGSEHATTLFK